MTNRTIQQYRGVAACGQTESASPHQLIDMLYGGLKDALNRAQGSVESGHIADKSRAFSNALGILETLQVSLDPQAGGHIADNLGRLYDFMLQRLTEANLHNDAQAIQELLSLTESLREAWGTIPVDQRQGSGGPLAAA